MIHGLGPGKPGPRAAKPITPPYVENNYRIEVKITFTLIAYLVLLCEFFLRIFDFSLLQTSGRYLLTSALNIETFQTELIDQQASSCSSILDTFPPDETTQFSEDFSVLPTFVPMETFEQVKNSGKSIYKEIYQCSSCYKLK